MSCLLVTPDELIGDHVELTGSAYHHLFRVKRLAVGERVRVVDGAGRARAGEIVAADRKRGRVELGAVLPSRESSLAVSVVVAALKPERASWLVEKLTELGVVGIHFLATARTPRTLGAGSLERLRRVAVAALEQCGRAQLPQLSGVHRWTELDSLLAGTTRRLVLDTPREDMVSSSGFPSLAEDRSAVLLVGPEGGWSDEERVELAQSAVVPWELGARTLRVETAAVVGAGCLLVAADRRTPLTSAAVAAVGPRKLLA